ncbi:MAG: amino acid ABC transporter permease [Anaerolineales bacterium]|jgi:general L-amino acid transport system permease protein
MPPESSPGDLVQFQSQIPFWRDERVLRIVAQIVSAIVVIGLLYWAVINVVDAAEQRGLSLGFNFLQESAGFPVGESDLPYDPSRSFLYAFLVGVLNTLKVSIVGIFFATILGTIIGIARLSTNWLVNRLALVYIEFHRNIPLLVLLLLWYRGIFTRMPDVQDSITLPGPIYFNQRGLYIPWPLMNPNGWLFVISIILGAILAIVAWVYLRRRQERTGKNTYFAYVSFGILIFLPIIGYFISGGDPLDASIPSLSGFNFSGGYHLTPEFTALLVGLVTYTAAFIAEVVRAGIQAVNRGQLEAARAIGLSYSQILSLVIIPQALRVIIPPLISQYLNLTKNSSLAIFIGYPEIFFIGKTTINQAGRAVQVFILIMAVYLSISLVTSFLLNVYNRRIQLVER